MPGTERGVRDWGLRGVIDRRPRTKGKGWEYAFDSLPVETQAALLKGAAARQEASRPTPTDTPDREALWAAFERLPQRQKDEATRRLQALRAVNRLVDGGSGKSVAVAEVARVYGDSPQTVQRWRKAVRGADRGDWLPLLAPKYRGRVTSAECDSPAWEMFKALYLTRAQRSVTDCYLRVQEAAAERGWQWPALRTIQRRIQTDVTRMVRVLLREGPEALDRVIPPMRRDRSIFHAMEAVNGDGVEFKPKCRWPDGTVARAKVWIWQDLYSGYVLTWRADVSENKDVLRLAFGDLVEQFGIPSLAYIDNTTAAANKWLTGGVANRYRWQIRDEDPIGIMPQVGTDVRFVLPAHGQSKPIERANRDLRQLIDRNPRFEGRGTEARPIPIEEFMEVLEHEIQRHNARAGRRTDVAQGRSFEAVFRESYERSPIRRATAEQSRLWLLAAERIRADRESGAIRLGRGPQGENRYWHERLAEHAGSPLVVRFDPQRLHESVHVYTLDGRYIAAADCTWRGGFQDTDASRAYHRWRARHKKAARRAAEAERGMRLATAVDQLVTPDHPEPPERQVVELARGRAENTRPQRAVGSDVITEETQSPAERHRFDDVVDTAWRAWKDRQI